MTIVQYSIFGLLALIVLVFLMVGISSLETLSSLSSITTSRGLITFLVTVVTVTIALILLLSSIVSDSSNFAQRFQSGKEIFVALVGVLGTIIGFYFGQTADQNNLVRELEVGPAYATAAPTADGQTITLVSFARGGKAPYSYEIDFSPKSIPDVAPTPSLNGLISATIATSDVDKDTDTSFVISVSDSGGRKATYDSLKTGDKLLLKKK